MNRILKHTLNKVPIGLIYSRLIAGFILIYVAYSQFSYFRITIVSLMIYGIISDIFDGIIARKLNVSSRRLRRMDSSIDQIFWICALVGAFIICKEFFVLNYVKLLVLLGFESATYLISFIRFRKEVATHAILSKFWALSILATMVEVILTCNSTILFNICIYLGIATRIEIIAILLIIKEWCNDVPSVYHAILLRKGKPIKRHKLFNG